MGSGPDVVWCGGAERLLDVFTLKGGREYIRFLPPRKVLEACALEILKKEVEHDLDDCPEYYYRYTGIECRNCS